MFASVILIFYPQNLYIYAFMCCLWGILSIMDKGRTNGYLMFLLGMTFAYNQGFFTYHKKIKALAILGLLCTSNLALLRFGTRVLAESLLDGLFVIIFFTFMYFLFREKIELYFAGENKKIKLSEKELTEEELDILKCVLNGQQYKNIGMNRNKSESSIKQIMIIIFQKLGIQNKKELLELYTNNKIIF
ncbi:helix-turn-helix transcriptional regulator [Treponema brennaborense]|nr:LuxR C-terminal-related transcriptional regulator [Treponema brennaborense]